MSIKALIPQLRRAKPRIPHKSANKFHRNRKNRPKVKGPLGHIRYLGRDVYILGTAHVSPESVEDVTRFINKE